MKRKREKEEKKRREKGTAQIRTLKTGESVITRQRGTHTQFFGIFIIKTFEPY